MPGDTRQSSQRSVRRSAIILAVVALAVYAGFILAGVLRSPGAGA